MKKNAKIKKTSYLRHISNANRLGKRALVQTPDIAVVFNLRVLEIKVPI